MLRDLTKYSCRSMLVTVVIFGIAFSLLEKWMHSSTNRFAYERVLYGSPIIKDVDEVCLVCKTALFVSDDGEEDDKIEVIQPLLLADDEYMTLNGRVAGSRALMYTAWRSKSGVRSHALIVFGGRKGVRRRFRWDLAQNAPEGFRAFKIYDHQPSLEEVSDFLFSAKFNQDGQAFSSKVVKVDFEGFTRSLGGTPSNLINK